MKLTVNLEGLMVVELVHWALWTVAHLQYQYKVNDACTDIYWPMAHVTCIYITSFRARTMLGLGCILRKLAYDEMPSHVPSTHLNEHVYMYVHCRSLESTGSVHMCMRTYTVSWQPIVHCNREFSRISHLKVEKPVLTSGFAHISLC